MSDAPEEIDERLNDLLDEYEDSLERGEEPDVDSLCREHPDLANELRRRIDAIQQINGYFDDPSTASNNPSEETLRINSALTRLTFHDKGGLGAVYRAEETGVHRQVAVKFIHRNLVKDPDSRARFELEAEVTGRLEHPGIVPLYGFGEADNGRQFYYMRFIEGETLDKAIGDFHSKRPSRGQFAEQSVEFKRILTSFVSVCKTIAYAHNRGIVHRDIKPANVMLGKFGETLVVDWGLAVPVARDQRFVASGEATLPLKTSGNSGGSTGSGIGTVAYMSPEQAKECESAPASDIYSLGATLYKILTGEPSVTGKQITALKEQIIAGKIVAPRVRLSSIPAPLEAICLKAMALHPQDRYDTALQLAEDVESYLADADVSAYDEPMNRKLARLARKHRFAAQATVVALLAISMITALSAGWSAVLARSEKQARKENLITSANFLAESIAHQIDKRWRIMENARSSPKLIESLLAINAEPDNQNAQQELQRWLQECKVARNVFNKQKSNWVIFDQRGTLVARDPYKPSVIGRNFSFRDYFHGVGHDLQEGDPELAGQLLDDLRPHQFLLENKLEPHNHIHSAHLSDVFLSTATKHLQVAFTVPIWDRAAEDFDKKVIGVFSISLDIQNLLLPDNAMLVQMRPDQLTEKSGLVISHPHLRPHTDVDLPPRVENVLDSAERLKRMRLRELDRGIRTIEPNFEPIINDFVDPVTAANGGETNERLATFEPVIIESRPFPINDTGWMVIVTEKRHLSNKND